VTTAVLYPNPVTTSSQVSLQVPLTQASEVSVEVYTLSFRKVQQRNFPQVAVGSFLTLELKDQWGNKLANGLYYVFVHAQGRQWTVKLLILR
jgi:hypothetical protein